MPLALVVSFRDLPVGARFRLHLGDTLNVKIGPTRYQLVDDTGQPVPEITYDLAHRGGQDQPVFTNQKAA